MRYLLHSKERRLVTRLMWLGVAIGCAMVPSKSGQNHRSPRRETQATLFCVRRAITEFSVANRAIPEELSEALPPQTNCPLMHPGVRLDAARDGWGTAFSYARRGDHDYELRSAGPDREFETPDDESFFT